MFHAENAKDSAGKPLVDSLMDFGKEATAGFNPVTILGGLDKAFWHPIDTAKGMLTAQDALRLKALESFKKGDYVTGSRHMLEWAIPVLGPRMAQAGDWTQQGEYAKGLGATADLAAQIVLPKVAGQITSGARGMLSRTANPAEAAAVQFGESSGIPMDAGTVTGNTFVKAVQKRLGGTLGGSTPVEAGQRVSAAGLERVGGQIADAVSPAPASGVSAGEGVQGALTKKIQDLHATATTAYERVRQAEQQQAARIAQTGGIQAPTGVPQAFTTVPLAVDLASTKQALRPLYDRMMRAKDIAPPMGAEATALKALDRLMSGPDLESLSVVDEALSDLKSLSRNGDIPELRSTGQARAAVAVKELDTRVRAAAAKAGPDVLQALEEGRAATKAKYDVADARDLLSDEPGQVFKQLTANKDTALNKLRAVQRIAPDQIPVVARAYLEQMLELATAEGGFAHADRLFADWQKLGPQTKATLFSPQHVSDLDNFFLLAKKIGENPNPSGTAVTVDALKPMQLLGYLPTKALAKVLYTPAGVKLLTNAVRLSVNTAPAARAFAVSQLGRAAAAAGVPLETPAGAGSAGPPQPSQR